MNRLFCVAVSVLASLSTTAAAQDAARPAKDGFHFTFMVGGVQHTTTASLEGSSENMSISGFGIGGLVAVGWTLTPGFVLGAGGGGGHIFSPTVEFAGTESDSKNDLIFFTSGVYLDYSLSTSGQGLHVHALLGVGTTEEGSDDIPDVAIGFGGILGLGYRVPISATWAFDVVGRMQILTTSSETKSGDSVSNLSLAPALLAGVTWH